MIRSVRSFGRQCEGQIFRCGEPSVALGNPGGNTSLGGDMKKSALET